MQKSDQLNELFSALAKAQSSIEGAVKDSKNPFFKSNYADLSSVMEAIRKPFADNGLSYTQVSRVTEQGNTILETVLAHASGQWISGEYPIVADKPGPQALGSALTYARRYSLSAIAGVSQIDDDGNSATKFPVYGNHDNDIQGFQSSELTPQAATPANGKPKAGVFQPISLPQQKRLFAIKSKSNWSDDDLKSLLLEKYGVDSSRKITWDKYDAIIQTIEQNPK